ncbi:MAG: DnaB protein helicase protein, partial [Planctomycetaceae bacterium]|nr:DnaB protein helicase protein [Planctomycetaceae bacterium]
VDCGAVATTFHCDAIPAEIARQQHRDKITSVPGRSPVFGTVGLPHIGREIVRSRRTGRAAGECKRSRFRVVGIPPALGCGIHARLDFANSVRFVTIILGRTHGPTAVPAGGGNSCDGAIRGADTGSIRVGSVALVPWYFIGHANAAFRMMGKDESQVLAEHILHTIQHHGISTFTKRGMHQHVRRRIDTPNELDIPLKKLADHNFIRELPQTGVKVGRPRTATFEVNPKVREVGF